MIKFLKGTVSRWFDVRSENVRLRFDNQDAQSRIKELEHALLSKGARRIKIIDPFDGEPTDLEYRQVYVAQVAAFFQDIFERKGTAMIADVREQLAKMNYAEEIPKDVPRESIDWFLRGSESALWLLYEWMETITGEHKSNINDKN